MNEYETRQFFGETGLKPNNESDWNVTVNKEKESFTFSKSFDIYNIPVVTEWSKHCKDNLTFTCNER